MPAAAGSLPRLIGKARAIEMMMLAERIPAAQALDWGMIYKVVPDEELLAEAQALAARLAAGPTVVLRADPPGGAGGAATATSRTRWRPRRATSAPRASRRIARKRWRRFSKNVRRCSGESRTNHLSRRGEARAWAA